MLADIYLKEVLQLDNARQDLHRCELLLKMIYGRKIAGLPQQKM
jgi:hypothetical protein